MTPLLRLVPLVVVGAVFAVASFAAPAGSTAELENAELRLRWRETPDGWKLDTLETKGAASQSGWGALSGEYTILFSAGPVPSEPVPIAWPGGTGAFPESSYYYLTGKWREATTPVALNTAGEAVRFWPKQAEREGDGRWVFRHENDHAAMRAVWSLDPAHPRDIRVSLTLTAKRAGWFSMATPTLAEIAPTELAWAVVPGCFQGAAMNPDLVLAHGYGLGLPDQPVLARDRVASTLASIATTRAGGTLGVIAEPGTAVEPIADPANPRREWRLGLSHMNRASKLAPTLYHPVLGEEGSKLAVGESRTFTFRYSLPAGDWLEVVRHAAYEVYRLNDFLRLKQPQRSLSQRLIAMHRYVADDQTSLWRKEEFGGVTMGAQAYYGGVVGADRDAMKNSDYGAMWMLATLTQDPRLVEGRLPFARAFKLVQQQRDRGFFEGAAMGQYFLSKSRRFTEEWGSYVEPVALTYYTLLDQGNILLFAPGDAELRERLRLGADRLLAWQHADGHWEVAYDKATQKPRFTELPDLRPTFYGLLVAYRVLGDSKYLTAARRGADWLIANAVNRGAFLGVCGDARFTQDFATAQIAQALLDLHASTQEPRYRDAGIAAGKFYLASVFTHPLATSAPKKTPNATRADWELSQMGLSYEHGTALGSVNNRGPILLASHAGLFVRLHGLTGDPLFRDFARAAVWARDAFVDSATSVASYYWNATNTGPGPYPHHAWWQIGWITDYLIAEAELRSAGGIALPRGFFTPKVGPHASYGFAPGKIFGETAELRWGDLATGSPAIDYLLAQTPGATKRFAVLLNNSAHAVTAQVRVDLSGGNTPTANVRAFAARDGTGRPMRVSARPGQVSLELPPAGIAILSAEP